MVSVIELDEEPIHCVSEAAGTSHGKRDVAMSRAKTCYKLGHMSVFEFASFTARIQGISRACAHQLVRHRLASFVELSQRYTKVDTNEKGWYVVPPEIKEDALALQRYEYAMGKQAELYERLLAWNYKPEDARYVLPQATKTTVTMRMNARELFHFLDLRQDKAAQWEIRELANRLEEELRDESDEWALMPDWRKE